MNKLDRLIDANLNRTAEGLRVLEDIARFYYDNPALTEDLKIRRHQVRKAAKDLQYRFLLQRNSQTDPGLIISQKNSLDNKSELKELISSNFKRVQEGLRVIEESLKVQGFYNESKTFELLRYEIYALEKAFFSISSIADKREKLNTDLYCLTAEEHSLGRSNIEVVKAMLASNIKIIQYREKDKSKLLKLQECKEIRDLTRAANATFIVNDDIDIALTVSADGIHIGQNDLPLKDARKLIGENMLIGVSTHSPLQAQAAIAEGADYIGVGPLFKTFTKKDVCGAVGLEYLDYAVKHVNIPFVAIGGIKEHNIAEVANHGAKCVALVTEIVGAEDIPKKIKSLRQKLASQT